MNLNRNWLLKGAAFFLLFGAAYYLNRYGIFKKSLEAAGELGPWGPVVFVSFCIPAGILFVPSVMMFFTAGALFGLRGGFLFSLLGTTLGSAGAFLIGRYLARDWVAEKFSKNKKFQLLAEMVRRKGWKIILLARLSPLFPFMIGNYAFGLTPISLRSYFGASLLGSIPSTAVYVYLGTLSRNLIFKGHSSGGITPAEWGLFLTGLAATVFLAFYLMRIARSILRQDKVE